MPRPQGRLRATHADPSADTDLGAPVGAPALPAAPPSENALASLDLCQHTVILTEGMNALKRRINAEKQSRRENPGHLDPISSDEEEVQIPIAAVPISTVLPSPPPSGPPVVSDTTTPLLTQNLCPPGEVDEANFSSIAPATT